MRRARPAKRGGAPLMIFLALLISLFHPAAGYALNPYLDGFNIRPGGTVAIGGAVYAVAVQGSDGRIVIGGDFTLTGGMPAVTLKNIARLNPDGTLDASFAPPVLDGPVRAVALQPDPVLPAGPDLVLVGGAFTGAGGVPRKGIARLAGANGALDAFDPVTASGPVTIHAITVLPSGTSILVGGVFSGVKDGISTRNLAGLSVAGGNSGELDWRCTGGLADDAGNAAVYAIALQDGAVVAGGEFVTTGSANLARFTPLGDYDASFTPPAPGGVVRALAVQEDGKILLGGEFTAGGLGRNYLARLMPDGTADTFDARLDLVPGSFVSAIALQPDGRIVAGGRLSVGPAGKKRANLARFNIDQTLDAVTFPAPDGQVTALVRQGDGKILAGGAFTAVGSVPRTALARFYPHGTLDDDIPQIVQDYEMVLKATQRPDGRTFITGYFQDVLGEPVSYTAGLTRDWSFDYGFGPIELERRIVSVATVADRGLLLGGDFFFINGLPQHNLMLVDDAGAPVPGFNATVDSYLDKGWGGITSIVQPARGPLGEGGMFYAGGDARAGSTWRYLARYFETGERDERFVPAAELDAPVNVLAMQREDLVLVGTEGGKLMRLFPSGDLDPSWNGGNPLAFPWGVYAVSVLADGRILVAGDLRYPGSVTSPATGETEILSRNILLLDGDGAVDESFVLEARSTDTFYSSTIYGASLETDGAIIIYGIFDQVWDGFATPLERRYAARILPDGRVDPDFDLGLAAVTSMAQWQVNVVGLQPDGKLLIGGDFDDLGGRSKLARPFGGWSPDELSVAADGASVTWRRSGRSSELWRVWFEHSFDGVNWELLGHGSRIPGGWRLDGLDPERMGFNANRYVRARGLTAGDMGSAGVLVESVRLYHLKRARITVTVTADPLTKTYGQDDPALTYTCTPPLKPGDQFTGALSRVPGRDAGSYAITQETLALGSGYELVYKGAHLTITRAPLLISADNQTRTAGSPNPSLTASCTGLAPWDTAASLGGAPLIATAVDASTPKGSYPITAGLGGITSANYEYSFADGTLTVTGRTQSITPPAPVTMTYGDPPLAAGGSASSGLPLVYASSDPAVITVADGGFSPGAAGSAVITVSQPGDDFWDPAAFVPVPCTVEKAPLTVVAEDKSRAYLTPNPELTVLYRGFVKGEGSSVLSGAPTLSTTAATASPVGSYPILAGVGTLQAANYSITALDGTLNVYRSCQEITFPAIPERTYGDPPFEIVASACSGLPLAFRSSDPGVARVEGNVVTITGAGSAVISASQAGSGDLETAPERSQPLVVHRSGQQVAFSSPARKVVGDPPFDLEGTATSGLAVSYQSSDPAVATVAGKTVTVVGAGIAVIAALQPGDGNYLPAAPVSGALTVAAEGTPPELSLSTLNSGASTSNPVLNLFGRAADPSGIESLTVQGRDRTADAPLFSSAVILSEGENSVSVAARDRAGNLSTHTFSITLDPLAPWLDVTTPADNSVTDPIHFSVSGTVTGGSTVTMTVNAEGAQFLKVTDGAFTATAPLLTGVNTLEFNAEKGGRSSRVKRSVTATSTSPSLAITSPPQDMRTGAASVLIRGSCGTSAAGGVLLTANGTPYPLELSGEGFERELPLRIGENLVTVEARTAGGEVSVAQRNVVRVELIPGDLNGDGRVDIGDAARLLRVSLSAEEASAGVMAHGDLAPLVDGVPHPDGVIDVGDVLVLLRRIVGLVRF